MSHKNFLRPGLTALAAWMLCGNVLLGIVAPVWSSRSGDLPLSPATPAVPFRQRYQLGVQSLDLDILETHRDAIPKTDQIDLLPSTGSTLTRVNLVWGQVVPREPTTEDKSSVQPDTAMLAKYDTYLRHAHSLGIDLIVTVVGNPVNDPASGSVAWASDTYCGPIYSNKVGKFGAVMAFLVNRYSTPEYGVRYWEVYNEPDYTQHTDQVGGCWAKNPDDPPSVQAFYGGDRYASMLRTVYPKMKAENPNIVVMSAGLAYNWFLQDNGTPQCTFDNGGGGWGGLFDMNFPDEMFAYIHDHPGDYFDVLAVHAYSAWDRYWICQHSPIRPEPVGKIENFLRPKMQAAGINKPVALTEVGYPTAGGTDPQYDLKLITYSRDFSAWAVVEEQIRAISADVNPIMWFSVADQPILYRYGLIGTDPADRKPGFYTERMLTSILGGVTCPPTGACATAMPNLPAGVEGYSFTRANQPLYALWAVRTYANDPAPAAKPVVFAGDQAQICYADSNGIHQQVVLDGSSGDLDGVRNHSITLSIDGNPRFVAPASGIVFMPRPALHRSFVPLLFLHAPADNPCL